MQNSQHLFNDGLRWEVELCVHAPPPPFPALPNATADPHTHMHSRTRTSTVPALLVMSLYAFSPGDNGWGGAWWWWWEEGCQVSNGTCVRQTIDVYQCHLDPLQPCSGNDTCENNNGNPWTYNQVRRREGQYAPPRRNANVSCAVLKLRLPNTAVAGRAAGRSSCPVHRSQQRQHPASG